MMTTHHVTHPTFDLTVDTTLEEPDMNQIKDARFQRNRDAMKSVDANATKTVFPKERTMNARDLAATRIQAYYRGYVGRKQYIALLYEQYEREEALQREKMLQQVEEGELLVENHRLEVEIDDAMTTRRNKNRHLQSSAITIQRAWRNAQEKRKDSSQHPMSVSNSNESLKLLKSEETLSAGTSPEHSGTVHGNSRDDTSSTSSSYRGGVPNKNILIDTDPESIVSDYSEMADQIKEHLANVQIIRKEDLAISNTMQNEVLVHQKIPQLPDETDEEYAKRLRKLNFLSLAQEFAELKKVDASALPFGAHKTQHLISPQSDTSSSVASDSERVWTDSTTTPVESSSGPFPVGDAACNNINAQLPDNVKLIGNVNEGQKYSGVQPPKQAWDDKIKEAIDNDNTDNVLRDNSSESKLACAEIVKSNLAEKEIEDSEAIPVLLPTKPAQQSQDSIKSVTGGKPKTKEAFVVQTHISNKKEQAISAERSSVKGQTPVQGSNLRPAGPVGGSQPDAESQAVSAQSRKLSHDSSSRRHQKQTGQQSGKQHLTTSQPRSNSASPARTKREKMSSKTAPTSTQNAPSPAHASSHNAPALAGSDNLDDFDVYNIESTMPQMDWAKIEEELKKAAEEEQKKKSQKNDRQEILRKLAMAPEEEPVVFDADKALKKSNIQSRFQHGQGLQVCFMNEQLAPSANQSAAPPRPEVDARHNASEPGEDITIEDIDDSNGDLKTRQQRLQHEATIALAQVRPMAHMQLMVEKRLKKKSPLADIVGIPGLGDDTILQLTPEMLQAMNLAQLQVVVNDLHSQIESLNIELMNQLVERDDLHMEQDSMLVDIEDLHRRAEELSLKVHSIPGTPKKKKDKKK